ncbi:MAG: hypothetical protein ACJ8F3_13150 [Xanthobacteraceae bacterium]
MTYVTYLTHNIRHEGDPRVLQSGPSSLSGSDRLGKALGWFSLALGIAEMVAPERITRALGMRGKEGLVRAYGAREIASGMLCLSTERQAGLWSRVAGDAVDVATLAAAWRQENPKRENVATALAMVAGVTLLDAVAAQSTTSRHARGGQRRLYYDRSGFPKGLAAARAAAKTKRKANGGALTTGDSTASNSNLPSVPAARTAL